MKKFLLFLISTTSLICILQSSTTGQVHFSSRLDVRIITDEADAVLDILAKKNLGQEITESDWQKVFSSEGYTRLKKRELSMSRPFDDLTFREFALSGEIMQKRNSLAETLAKWKQANINEVAARSFAYLPAISRIRAKIYPVIKPRPNNFVFEYPQDPAIFLYLDPAASKEKFELILAHELHHIGFGSGCATSEQQEEIKKLSPDIQKVLTWLSPFGEGFATLAAAGGPDIYPYSNFSEEERANWDKDIIDFNANLRTVEQFLVDVSEGKLSEKEINERGFSFFGVQGRSGFWYTVGWQMDVVIEKIYGREKLIEVMCDRRRLLSTYNKAVKKYNHRYHKTLAFWSKEFVKKIG